MRYIKRNYYKNNTKENILKYIMICILLGSILGAIFFCFISDNSVQKLDMFIDSFIQQLEENKNIDIINLIEIFFKDVKYLIFIWFLAFIPFGEIFIYLIIFCKGFFVSFTSAIFFSKYNFSGINSMFNSYILENIVTIILIFFISYKSINYYKNKMKKSKIDIKNYLKHLFICIIFNFIMFILFYYI